MSPAPRFGRLADGARPAAGGEAFTSLASLPGARIERIASRGPLGPESLGWYEQDWPEFVLLVSGAALLDFGGGQERRLLGGTCPGGALQGALRGRREVPIIDARTTRGGPQVPGHLHRAAVTEVGDHDLLVGPDAVDPHPHSLTE